MADTEYVVGKSLDSILENLPIGSVERAIGNNLYGINYRQTGNAVPRSKDGYGFAFFTRPQLNLSTLNLTNYRGFYNLLTKNNASYQAFTRLMLDPRLNYLNRLSCPFVDPQNAFISVLTNNIVSMSGWPDLTVPVYTSATGLYGEEHSFVDGVTNHYEAFDIDAVYRNTRGNPLLYFFYIWIKYSSLVFEGILNPYFDMITENEIDYMTRIYRVVTDPTKRYVTQIGCTGASFPVNVPTGNLFDLNTDTPFNTRNAELNIRFRCMGFMAFEDIIKYWFNQAVAIFNPSMRKVLQHDLDNWGEMATREDPAFVYEIPGSDYVKIPYLVGMAAELQGVDAGLLSVNHRAVPFINLHTNELEWWVPQSQFGNSGDIITGTTDV